MKQLNPPTLITPKSPYSHGLFVESGKSWLYVTGQVANRPDGSIPEGIEAQSRLVWENIGHVLTAAELNVSHIVRVGIYLLSADHFPVFNRARDAFLGDSRPAITALVVAGLANPKYLAEVDIVACR